MVDRKMNKYWGIVYSMIDNSDVTLEVVDARFPSICRSNQLESYVNNHPSSNLLIALNKVDLVSRDYQEKWINWFEENGFRAVGVSAKDRLGTQRLRRSLLMTSNKKTALVAVVGFPNTGKSSLINTLRGKNAASVAPIPGKTRGEQKVKISNSIRMFDTPGIVPIKLPTKHNILLGLTPITKIRDIDIAALEFYEEAESLSPGVINDYYDIDANHIDILEVLALKKNRLLRQGEPDINEAARIMLSDHIKGRFIITEDVGKPLRLNY